MIGQLRKLSNFLMLLNTWLKWHKNLERNRVFWQSQKGIQEEETKVKVKEFFEQDDVSHYALGRRIVCLLSLKMKERRKCKRDCCCPTGRRLPTFCDRKPCCESWILCIYHATNKVVCTSGIIWDTQWMNMYISPKKS